MLNRTDLHIRPWTSTVQFSRSVLFNCLWPHEAHHARPPCPSPTPRVYLEFIMSIELMPSNHLIFCHPLPLPPSSFQTSGSFQMSQFFTSGGQSIEFQLQHQSFQWIFRVDFLEDWLVWSFCPRDSQESPPTTQFKSISFSVLSFLYGPTLTSIHDYWKNHSFD